MPFLFAATLFLSAALIFWVQPLVGKMVLPLLGGTPAVWNTCLLFFQATLLGGYAYVLALTRWAGTRAQVLIHAALLAAAAWALPPSVGAGSAGGAPAEGSPAGWLLLTLATTAGLPFFALSATAPLLQKWYTRTGSASAGDPYFLYSASNAGSLAALVGFPLLLEPLLTVGRQGLAWSLGYAALAALVLGCAAAAWAKGTRATEARGAEGSEAGAAAGSSAVNWGRRLRWVLLAFVPSSLVLGATTYVTTDIASAPLLWVLPLSLYLSSFVIVFARRPPLRWRAAARVLPGAGVLLALVYLSGATEPAWFLILFHLLFLFVASVVCHGQLAEDRPGARHLAEYYLLLSAGGALGGLFNAVVAPLVFDTIVEYPLIVVLACYLRPAFRPGGFPLFGLKLGAGRARPGGVSEGGGEFLSKAVREGGAAGEADGGDGDNNGDGGDGGDSGAGRAGVRWRERRLDVLLALLIGAGVLALAAVASLTGLGGVEQVALVLGVPLLVLNHFFAGRPARFALGLGAVMLAGSFTGGRTGETAHAERNFFGTIRVSLAESGETMRLYHGSTLHGRQFIDPARACEPLSYYHREGPLGPVFAAYEAQGAASPNVAVVGLGTGASVAYSKAGQSWTFYEIDPAVARIAQDSLYFTYLSRCAAAPARVVLGDARVRLREAPEGAYGLIVLDAFSSDAVPAHLLTREALDLYLSKLAPGGLVAYHTSNRTLELERVVAGLASEAGLVARFFDDPDYQPGLGKEPSEWVVVARSAADLGPLGDDARWQPLGGPGDGPGVVWRDDFSNILSVFRWL
ncbi:MAG TPA: fused MFS/spermidine synthase [Pyrinomonadaceae bacterium]|nr:fused MFS/spermidine synthase [Pyrinomonadaceae bacterium]